MYTPKGITFFSSLIPTLKLEEVEEWQKVRLVPDNPTPVRVLEPHLVISVENSKSVIIDHKEY